jgi:hypothetical protein
VNFYQTTEHIPGESLSAELQITIRHVFMVWLKREWGKGLLCCVGITNVVVFPKMHLIRDVSANSAAIIDIMFTSV